MSHYEHLSTLDREAITVSHDEGQSIRRIAQAIGRAPSTVSRELHRNTEGVKPYSGVRAQQLYELRRKRCKKHKRLEDPKLKAIVIRKLKRLWSPEQIENRLKFEQSEHKISFVTIYRSIHAGELDKELRKKAVRYLRHRGKKRRKKGEVENRGKFPISHTIWERPEKANDREETGHWEGDTVIGKQGSACVVTLVERRTELLLVGKVPGRRAKPVKDKIIALLSPLQKQYVRSITLDRGKEFAEHAKITTALNQTPVYFCDPHSPWQRGTNENTNGLLRQYLPKGYDIAKCSEEQLQRIMVSLNTRPRKSLNWKTPLEAYALNVLHLI